MITSATSDRCGILANVKLSVVNGQERATAISLRMSRDAFISISCDFFPSLFKCLNQATTAKRKYGTFSSQFPKRLL